MCGNLPYFLSIFRPAVIECGKRNGKGITGMKELDSGYLERWADTRRKYMKLMREYDGTCYVVGCFIRNKESFSEKKADSMIADMISYLPDSYKKTKIQFYEDYLFMASVLAFQQYKMRESKEYSGDIIFDAGLGYDTCFSGMINRALTEDAFLIPNHGTKLATGEISDLDGYLEKIYKNRRSKNIKANQAIYHPVFAGFGAIADILEGREYDKKLDGNISPEEYERFREDFPCRERFLKSYYRYRTNYFKTGIRDDFQKNIEHIVKCHTIANEMSHYDDDPLDEYARGLIDKPLLEIWEIYYGHTESDA